MRRAATLAVIVLMAPLPVLACMWDRDTPGTEAQGLPEVVRVLTGRFERNPPLYYEMRLARVTAEIAAHPESLANYDDAGVASDRLGRGDEAIAWMARKREQLDKLDPKLTEVKQAAYRYHANLGTFLVHRWIRQGADRGRIKEAEAARDEIARAMEINPDAHFGREKYRLSVLKWIVNPPKATGESILPNFLEWPSDQAASSSPDGKALHEAVRGLSGLIALGNAWESVDVFNALSAALQEDGGRNALACFAWLRCLELADEGKTSWLPDAPRGVELRSRLYPPARFNNNLQSLESEFRTLREEADEWRSNRLDYMMSRLQVGRHPDTDPDFWKEYSEAAPPKLSMPNDSGTYEGRNSAPSTSSTVHATAFNPVIAFSLILSAILLLAAVAIHVIRLKSANRQENVSSTVPESEIRFL